MKIETIVAIANLCQVSSGSIDANWINEKQHQCHKQLINCVEKRVCRGPKQAGCYETDADALKACILE